MTVDEKQNKNSFKTREPKNQDAPPFK